MKKMYIAPEVELLTMNVEMPMATSVVVTGGPGVGFGGNGDDTDDPVVKEDQDWDIWN